jgi:hypothetical protein
MLIQKNQRQLKLERETNQRIREGLIKEQTRDQYENNASLFI